MLCPVFLTHLGCTKRCTYCDQTYITEIDRVDLEGILQGMPRHNMASYEVGLYGGNIFGIEPELLKKIFACFDDYRDRILNFRVSTKPVPLNDEIISILRQNNVTVIELGIPTFNNKILEKINRDHTADDILRAYNRLKAEGFRVALQVMVGLPDETPGDIVHTVENIVALHPDYIRIYPLAIIKGTPLWRDYENGRFVPISFEDAVLRSLYIYLNAYIHNIRTVKMGLTDNEIIREKIVGGFYHPAFGSIVKSEGFFLAILTQAEGKGIKGNIEIGINKRDIPHVIGHRRANIERFRGHGIFVELNEMDIGQGSFIIRKGGKESQGDISDAMEGLRKKGFYEKRRR